MSSPTTEINSPHVIAFVVILAVVVAVGIYIADCVQKAAHKRRAKMQIRRNDAFIFAQVKEARRDFR